MITRKQFAAFLGFAFVAAWFGFNFGYAILCLAGAAAFYVAAAVLDGEVDLAEFQARLGGRQATPQAPSRPPPPPRPRPRVQ